jgi:hypothetical protein
MTLFEFQMLEEPEQVSVLYEEGVYIGKRIVNRTVVLLYQVDSFYAELFYKSYRRYIAHIKCSESTSLLDPYLEQIDVEYLVN